jgi:hypothetical protein
LSVSSNWRKGEKKREFEETRGTGRMKKRSGKRHKQKENIITDLRSEE